MDRPGLAPARVSSAVLLVLVASLVTPVAVAAATDSDHDGLPNTWERSYSLTSPSPRRH